MCVSVSVSLCSNTHVWYAVQDDPASGFTRPEEWDEPAEPAEFHESGPKKGKRKKRAQQAQTLSSSLQMLSQENPDCLFIVRRINKLGFKAHCFMNPAGSFDEKIPDVELPRVPQSLPEHSQLTATLP